MSGRASKRRALLGLPKVFDGSHVDLPHVHVERAREVRIVADRPFAMYADGDPIGEPAGDRARAPAGGAGARAGMTADAEVVIWHDLECGGYDADLPLWRELAADGRRARARPGRGYGPRGARPGARAAARSSRSTGTPSCSPRCEARARAEALDVATLCADARAFHAGRSFALLPGADADDPAPRRAARTGAAVWMCVRAHLVAGGRLAAALADPLEGFDGDVVSLPLPDMGEHDGWVYSSQPVALHREDGATVIERNRQRVAPDGERGRGHRPRAARRPRPRAARARGQAPTGCARSPAAGWRRRRSTSAARWCCSQAA